MSIASQDPSNSLIILVNLIASSPNARHTLSLKLNTKNFLDWKTQFIPLLNYQNLNSFIDGSTDAPPKTIISTTTTPQEISNPAYQTWFQWNQLFLSWLLSSLTEEDGDKQLL